MAEPASVHVCPPEARKFVLATAILASALGFIDGSVVAIAIPQIRESLDASFPQAQWISNAYVLLLSACILIGGAAGDRYGVRRTFGFGVLFFVIASQACALAWSPESLIAFRALQGLGAAIMVPGSMAIIARNFPRAERGRALGIWVAASSITTAMGPLLGGLLLSQGGVEIWRAIFAINLPLGGLALALLWWKVPDDPPRGGDRLDWQGAVLVTLGIGAFAAGLTWLGEGDGGAAAVVVTLAGLAITLAALWWEMRTPHAMIDLSLFRSRTFWGGNLMTLLVWAGLGTLFFFLPMVLVTGWQMTAFDAGLVFLPFALTISVLSPLVGRIVDRTGPRPFLVAGALASAAGYLWMGWAALNQSYWLGVTGSMILLGVGMGLAASPISVAVLGAVDDDKSGSASGINNMVARLSGLLGIVIFGGLVNIAFAATVRSSSLPADIGEMIVEAGFGERLTGALYQVTTQDVQSAAMNDGLFVVCVGLALMSLAGAAVAWLTIDRES